ncbi:MAG: hypothetical protein HWE27_04475 [Gammaproteobacteria bacterium]|nr:hypothetical protein [Gammaproteobacteria bacterium]
MKPLLFICFLFLYFPSANATTQSFKLGYEELYISEGRDNFAGQSMNTIGFETQADDIKAIVWHGESEDNKLSESSASLAKAFELDSSVSVEIMYTYLSFKGSISDDHELGATVHIGQGDGLLGTFTTTFGHQSSGIYSVAEVLYQKSINDFLVSPYLFVGLNKDYIRTGHNGLDHYQAGLRFSWTKSNLSITGHLSKTTPINQQSYDTLVEESWAGVKAIYSL